MQLSAPKIDGAAVASNIVQGAVAYAIPVLGPILAIANLISGSGVKDLMKRYQGDVAGVQKDIANKQTAAEKFIAEKAEQAAIDEAKAKQKIYIGVGVAVTGAFFLLRRKK
jgi:hypothetical protein